MTFSVDKNFIQEQNHLINRLQDQIIDHHQEITGLKNELKELEKEIERMEGLLEEKNGMIERLEKELEKELEKFEGMRALEVELRKKCDLYFDKLKSKERKINDLEKKVRDQKMAMDLKKNDQKKEFDKKEGKQDFDKILMSHNGSNTGQSKDNSKPEKVIHDYGNLLLMEI